VTRPHPAWACTPGLLGLRHREALLPEFAFRALPGPDVRTVLGWGRKPSSTAGRVWADLTRRPYVALEDGFLRSVGLGEAGTPSMSLLVDDLGVHYDARRPSRVEETVVGGASPDQRARARTLLDSILTQGLSKTNLGRPLDPGVFKPGRRILLVDQTAGDASLAGGLAGADSFAAMLAAARREEAGAQLIVKRHPAVTAGLKRGCLDGLDLTGLTLVDDVRAADLLAAVDAVWCVTSGLGFEALWRGLPVRTFGVPFYAGWGLTQDALIPPRRGVDRSVEDLVHAALVACARWVDPVTERACEPEEAVARLGALTRRARRLEGRWHAVGFTPPKRGPVRRLMNAPRARLTFHPSPASALHAARAEGGRLLVWAGREPDTLAEGVDRAGVALWRMEDGFLRSRGLGSDFTPALSAVLDGTGVHYDPAGPSDLERLIQAGASPGDQARAAALRARITRAGLSKYNLGGAAPPDWPRDRERILVVGQVEDDRSVLRGCGAIRTNAGLLAAVRAARPDAFLIWRDHPDVRAGNRVGALGPESERLADARADDLDVSACLDACDALATLTSLAGFEALMRGKPVMTFGRPFYAGWGLTEDVLTIPRRTARPTLDDLVAAALIHHPLYVAPNGLPCEVEDLVAVLEAGSSPAPARRPRALRAVSATLDRRPPPPY
jgi:capsular polysaccharide export protein